MRKLLMSLMLAVLLLSLSAAACALTVSGTLMNRNSAPLTDLAVTLERQDGTSLTTRTGNNGEWRFNNVEPGTYRVSVRLPQNQVAAPMSVDSRLLPSNSENAHTPWMNIQEDTKIPLASSRTTAGISIDAFVDSNENGGHMSTEPSLAGVEISVYADGYTDLEPIATGTTNRKGELSLPGMSPGTYRLKAVLPAGYMVGPIGSKVNIYYNCFLLNDQGEAWTDPITLEKGTQGMGIGAVAAGSARGTIYLDKNENGRRDADEAGFPQAQVSVISESQGFSMKAKVNEDGSFVLDPLQPGEYSFSVTLPEGWMFSAPGSDSLLTNGYSSTDAAPISVVKEKVTEIGQVGVIPASGLSVQFYLDENANGTMDAGEKPYPGTLSIHANGAEVLTVQADEKGVAAAPVVRAGELTLTALADSAHDKAVFSVPGDKNDFSADIAKTSVSVALSLGRAEHKLLYAGLTEPAAVSGQVYLDTNGNGVWDPLEGTLPEMTVQAVDAAGLVTAEAATDKSGTFVFPALMPKAQTLRFLLVDPYIASPAEGDTCIVSQTAEYGETDPLRLKPGQEVSNLRAALFKASTVQGHVLVHETDGSVTGLKGVSVSLIRRDGTPYSEYTNDRTDDQGFFYLKGILPGEYTVLYTLPEHALLETADTVTTYSPYITCADGSETELPEVYAVRTAQVAGAVTLDGAPLAGAALTAVNEESGAIVTVETDPKDGSFDLKLLRPGPYTVTAVLPEEYVFAADTMLVPALAQSHSSVSLTLSMGERITDLAVTAARPARISGYVYWDADHSDEMEPGEETIPAFSLILRGRDGETVETLTSDETGHFETSLLVPDQYQLEAVLEEDCILAGGRQLSLTEWAADVRPESGEALSQNIGLLRFAALGGQLWSLDGALRHVGGQKISLLNGDDDLPILETLTDENGQYAFDRLYPGVYRIRADLPEDFGFARVTDTDDRVSVIRSNANTGVSDPFTLTMGYKEYGADIGFGAKGSIGDFAWLDTNGNGMQDIGEKGIPGIILALYQGDELVAQTETDVYGHYMFKDLYPGKYTLKVTMHRELKATVHQDEFPLINSILPQAEGLTVETEVMIPSGATTLSDDVGFEPVTEGVLPDVMDTIPTIDWSNGGRKNR